MGVRGGLMVEGDRSWAGKAEQFILSGNYAATQNQESPALGFTV